MSAWVLIIILTSGMGGGGTSIGRAAAVNSVPFETKEACVDALDAIAPSIRRYGDAWCVKTGGAGHATNNP